MAKTALTELIEFIDRQEEPLKKAGLIAVMEQIYLEKEKEQIIEAWNKGYSTGYDLAKYDEDGGPENAEQYYKENFESQQ